VKVGEALVRLLEAYGVEYIFGVPGDTSMPFYDALYDAPGNIRHILARDERSASFMADVYARLTGRIGACLSTLGPGATNMTTGVDRKSVV
jgi:acetolactate synthase-1/2/3 large subunit